MIKKLLIVIGLSLTMFGCSCSSTSVTWRCTEEDKVKIKDSFDQCIQAGNKPYRCDDVKNLFCKKVITKND